MSSDPPTCLVTFGNIVTFSRRIAALYRQAIEWVHSVRNADVDPRFRRVTYEASFLADSFLRAVETFGPDLLRQLEVAAQLPPDSDITINATITVAPPDPSRCMAALQGAVKSILEGTAPAPPTGEPGYIYILVNQSMGNLVKIAKTTRSPRNRIAELSSATGVPTPFSLALDPYVEDCARAETYVHARLEKDGYRVAANREFFNVDLGTAINVVLEAQKIVSVRGV
jgi:T5orf172 domain